MCARLAPNRHLAKYQACLVVVVQGPSLSPSHLTTDLYQRPLPYFDRYLHCRASFYTENDVTLMHLHCRGSLCTTSDATLTYLHRRGSSCMTFYATLSYLPCRGSACTTSDASLTYLHIAVVHNAGKYVLLLRTCIAKYYHVR